MTFWCWRKNMNENFLLLFEALKSLEAMFCSSAIVVCLKTPKKLNNRFHSSARSVVGVETREKKKIKKIALGTKIKIQVRCQFRQIWVASFAVQIPKKKTKSVSDKKEKQRLKTQTKHHQGYLQAIFGAGEFFSLLISLLVCLCEFVVAQCLKSEAGFRV